MTTPSKGVKGFLLYSPVIRGFFFRVYDVEDKSKFKDYKLCAEDIEVEIIDRFTVLKDGVDGELGRLDYNDTVFGRKPNVPGN